MLFAHWLYWGAALLEIPKLVGTKRTKRRSTQKVEELDNSSSSQNLSELSD